MKIETKKLLLHCSEALRFSVIHVKLVLLFVFVVGITTLISKTLNLKWRDLKTENKLVSLENISLTRENILQQIRDFNHQSVMLYSDQTRQRVIQEWKQKDSITILANGGSTTAGAGGVYPDERFYSLLGNKLEQSFKIRTKRIHMGHGSRDSFHSFLMAESFFPKEVDLILWEFSMNDGYLEFNHAIFEREIRNLFIFWLRKISDFYGENPPGVILIYYWDSPFKVQQFSKTIQSNAFRSHQYLGANFDFVIGHIHVGGFLDNLNLSEKSYKALFLADTHHPNKFGHFITAELLHKLLTNETVPRLNAIPHQAKIEWVCKGKADRHSAIADLLIERRRQTKASFIADVPKMNPNSSNGILTPMLKKYGIINYSYSWEDFLTERADRIRSDRNVARLLPLCEKEERLVFDLWQYHPIHAIQLFVMNLQDAMVDLNHTKLMRHRRLGFFSQIQYALGALDITNLRVWIDGENFTGSLFKTTDSRCILGLPLYAQWLVLHDEVGASAKSIELCNAQSENSTSLLALKHLVLF
jgi:hypothetical protein